jgi:hypothetical protein
MTMSEKHQPSFSPARKWSIGFNVLLLTMLVFSVVVMVNFLSREFYVRWALSTRAKIELAPLTVNFLKTVTNQVRVTAYYDREDPLFTTVIALLNEYRRTNPNITVRTVDYLRESGAAQKVKEQYKLAAPSDKNLVIFEVANRVRVVDGNALAKYVLEEIPGGQEREFRRRPTAFLGEIAFTAALLDVTSARPMKAYFLRGHGEHSLASLDPVSGYMKFESVLQQNHIQAANLTLLGTNTVPLDANLLVIAGPTSEIPEFERQKIEDYLAQGGRLLALFNFAMAGKDTGLEDILGRWGVEVGKTVVRDPDNTMSGSDVIVSEFGKHPLVNPLLASRLHLVLPRAIRKTAIPVPSADAPRVDELAFTGPQGTTGAPGAAPGRLPLMVAVEKGALQGVVTERGSTRMVIVGDSVFLTNRQIDSAANRDFASYALNWLLDRTQLMQGLGPRPITDYQVVMTQRQVFQAKALLLAGLPGVVIALGGLVWLRRRR